MYSYTYYSLSKYGNFCICGNQLQCVADIEFLAKSSATRWMISVMSIYRWDPEDQSPHDHQSCHDSSTQSNSCQIKCKKQEDQISNFKYIQLSFLDSQMKSNPPQCWVWPPHFTSLFPATTGAPHGSQGRRLRRIIWDLKLSHIIY